MRKRLLVLLISFAISVVGVAFPSGAFASTVVWNNGDVFAGVGTGTYRVYDNAGTLKDSISNGTANFTTGCSFNTTQTRLYTTDFDGNRVVVYDRNVPHGIVHA